MAKLLKGGAYTMKSGGIGPDEYLFRALPHGRWTRVVLRVKEGRHAYEADKAALSFIFQNCERSYIWDLARYVDAHPDLETVSASEFVARYKAKATQRRLL